MSPSGHVLGINIGGRGVTGGDIPLGSLLLQGKHKRRVVQRRMEWVEEQRTLGRSPTSMEDSRDDWNCNHYGGKSYGGSSKEHEEFSMPLLGEDHDQGKKWFKRENS